MKEGMLQVQLTIPSLKTDATFTAALKSAEDLTLEIEGIIKVLETTSLQKAIVRYGIPLYYFSQFNVIKEGINFVCVSKFTFLI